MQTGARTSLAGMSTGARSLTEKAVVGGRVGERQPGIGKKTRVYVVAGNRLLQEALARMLTKQGEIEVAGMNGTLPFQLERMKATATDVVVVASSGLLWEDVTFIRKIRTEAAQVDVLLVGASGDETEFLQCVRAGVKGYLQRDAAAEDVLAAVRAVALGDAVCSGKLRALLFRYFEQEASSLPSASVHQQLGLTRREQQLIPLISQGLTNKEIANHFCLSEQTVKNHLYRMKHKVGAEDRLGIVQVCRTQGFMF
jgi:DNA-binding NarL/FixJ family response regulator